MSRTLWRNRFNVISVRDTGRKECEFCLEKSFRILKPTNELSIKRNLQHLLLYSYGFPSNDLYYLLNPLCELDNRRNESDVLFYFISYRKINEVGNLKIKSAKHTE